MGFLPRRGRRFSTTVAKDPDSAACAIILPFEPKAAFGRARAPVTVTINSHSFRTTTATMGGMYLVPLNRGNREAAGVGAGDAVTVHIEPDDAPRVITPPSDLSRALAAANATGAWNALSFTHQREHVEAIEEAKKPETRARRIARCVDMVAK